MLGLEEHSLFWLMKPACFTALAKAGSVRYTDERETAVTDVSEGESAFSADLVIASGPSVPIRRPLHLSMLLHLLGILEEKKYIMKTTGSDLFWVQNRNHSIIP